MFSLAVALLSFANLHDHHEDRLKLQRGKAGNTLVVSGPTGGPYDRIGPQFELNVDARLPGEPNNPIENRGMTLFYDGKAVASATIGGGWHHFRVQVPHTTLVRFGSGYEVDPVAECNKAFATASEEGKTHMRRNGDYLEGDYGYRVTGVQHWVVNKSKMFEEWEDKRFTDSENIPIIIRCEPIGGGQQVMKIAPLVKNATLRAQLVGEEEHAGQLCPDKVRLYGRVETGRKGDLWALMRGTNYLSPRRSLQNPGNVTRSVTETYDIRWAPRTDQIAGSEGKAPLMSRDLAFDLNVADANNRHVARASAKITAACKLAPKRVRIQLPSKAD
ncbi:hypothetical protein [Sphingomicrobium clamense]|uniref:Uncharacterized protein n=1 Tax=Sphingomicrobium clamense TaxID=2851013 RepID=A0ABS6V6M7_9SPHN|nr:hypothetical protein [Sphingomicrobium sp. B8]MBW0145232.1 hypothetical protein [Sphingomicrobium sp. B8]